MPSYEGQLKQGYFHTCFISQTVLVALQFLFAFLTRVTQNITKAKVSKKICFVEDVRQNVPKGALIYSYSLSLSLFLEKRNGNGVFFKRPSRRFI